MLTGFTRVRFYCILGTVARKMARLTALPTLRLSHEFLLGNLRRLLHVLAAASHCRLAVCVHFLGMRSFSYLDPWVALEATFPLRFTFRFSFALA